MSADWVKRYGTRIDSHRSPKGDNVRQEWAEQVGQDGFTLVDAVYAPQTPQWLREIPAVQVLRRAWVEQYHRDDKGVRWREGKDLAPGRSRLSCLYDTDARYGTKRGSGWCGFKTHLSETCEPDAPHLITHVATTDATVTDTEMTGPIHHALAARELLPGEHVVDAGYVTVAHTVTARDEHHVELLSPVGLDTCHENPGEHFTKSAFTIDWQAKKVTCPAGQSSASVRQGPADHRADDVLSRVQDLADARAGDDPLVPLPLDP